MQSGGMCGHLVEECCSCSKGFHASLNLDLNAMEYCQSQLLKASFVQVQAAEKLKITAAELYNLRVADGVIPVMTWSFSVCLYHLLKSILFSASPPNIPQKKGNKKGHDDDFLGSAFSLVDSWHSLFFNFTGRSPLVAHMLIHLGHRNKLGAQ